MTKTGNDPQVFRYPQFMQQEIITWKKYPELEPQKLDEYLVQTKWGNIRFDMFTIDGWYSFTYDYIVAWAELPKGIKNESN